MNLTLCVVTFGAVAILFCNVEASAYDSNIYNDAEVFTGRPSCREKRIINGMAGPHIPSIAMILKDRRFVCAGSIINPQWILTAAHCVVPRVRRYTVKTGTKYRNGIGTISNVAKIIVHSNYSTIAALNTSRPFGYDFALFGLKCSLFFDKCNTNAAILPHQFDQRFKRDDLITAFGWGKFDRLTNELEYAQFHILPKKECEKICKRPIHTAAFCLTSAIKEIHMDKAHLTKGDSGGPAFSNGLLLGVTSGGCLRLENTITAADVLGNTTMVRDWIDEVISRHTS